MRNTRKSGQILWSKKRPRPTRRSGRGSRTNFNTSHQIPARVIEADSAHAVWVPDPEIGPTDPTGRSCGRDHSPFNWFAETATSLSQFASLGAGGVRHEGQVT